ncbi:Protein NRT1/ PTR FAMILY 1.2 [Linum perenne]
MVMEGPQDCEMIMSKKPLLSASSSCNKGRGGFRALLFIIVTDALEKIVSYGLPMNMMLYLTREYGMKNSDGANLIFIWVAATNFTPVVAAFLADSYMGRFRMIAFGSISSILGTLLLCLTAGIPEARPQPCVQSTGNCKQATMPQLLLLYASLGLISIGSGSMRSSCMAFGADQIMTITDSTQNSGMLERIVSWFFVSTTVSILFATTVIVYIQEVAGWTVGFGVPMILMIFSALSFFSASSLYAKQEAKASLITELARVPIAAFRNRGIKFPSQSIREVYHHSKSDEMHLEPSDNLRFLNKACIIRSPENDLIQEGRARNPWGVCTVDEVEDVKAVVKIFPIWFAGMMMSLPGNQVPFHLLQLNTMDRHITLGFQIPAASFPLFITLTLLIWIPLYDRIIIPVASKLKGKPTRLPVKQRLGLGILVSSVSMTALGLVERIRRERAIAEGLSDNPSGIVDMSAMWFLMYYIPFGVAEAFSYVAQSELYYSELPKSMASISTTFYQMGLSMGSLVSSLILSTVNTVTKTTGGGEESWVGNNINRGRYDYYYWILGGDTLTILDVDPDMINQFDLKVGLQNQVRHVEKVNFYYKKPMEEGVDAYRVIVNDYHIRDLCESYNGRDVYDIYVERVGEVSGNNVDTNEAEGDSDDYDSDFVENEFDNESEESEFDMGSWISEEDREDVEQVREEVLAIKKRLKKGVHFLCNHNGDAYESDGIDSDEIGYHEEVDSDNETQKTMSPYLRYNGNTDKPYFETSMTFSSMTEVRAAIKKHAITERRDVKWVKNDPTRVRLAWVGAKYCRVIFMCRSSIVC